MHFRTASSFSIANTRIPAGSPQIDSENIMPQEEQEDSIAMGFWAGDPSDIQAAPNDSSFSPDLGLITPRTPFVYGAGTSLSDIGEVTEAENTPSEQKPGSPEKKVMKQSQSNSSRRWSLTNGTGIFRKRAKMLNHKRQVSNESMSTVASKESCVLAFKDLEDNLSADDSVFQGDDEDSALESDSDDTIASQTQRSWKDFDRFDYDENSSAALSRRAERILMNAKRRLNTLEDNLYRARTSFVNMRSNSISTARNMSPFTHSTPSSSENEDLKLQKLEASSLKKKRWDSRQEAISDEPYESGKRNKKFVSQSLTAEPMPLTSNQLQSQAKSKFPSSAYNLERDEKNLKILHSLPISREIYPFVHTESSIRENDNFDLEIASCSKSSFSEKDANQLGSVRILTRSASSLQMRDLEYQVQGLKGRLSILRARTRDDNIKRRSLQSLRSSTPSTEAEKIDFDYISNHIQETPDFGFGAVDKDTSGENQLGEHTSTQDFTVNNVSSNFESEINPNENMNLNEGSDRQKIGVDREISQTISLNSCSTKPFTMEKFEDSESDTSLYFDTAVSHEDREDAFDYEHFFLHSALGTIGCERRDSSNSEDSIETTRGFPVLSPQTFSSAGKSGIHFRSESTDTLSTMLSFETATEGLEMDSDVEDNVIDDLDLLTAGYNQHRHNHPPNTQGSSTYQGVMPQSFNRSLIPDSDIETLFSVTTDTRIRKSYKAKFSLQGISNSQNLPSESEEDPNISSKSYRTDGVGTKSSSDSPSADVLSTDDQVLIKRLLNSLGECVLSLQEAGKTYDSRVWRRRLDAARRVLEGVEGAV